MVSPTGTIPDVPEDTGTYNPLMGGISIGPCRKVDDEYISGTLVMSS